MNENCTHHFILESPNGFTCLGTCKKCGIEKTHFNSAEPKVIMREIKKGVISPVKNITLHKSRSIFNRSMDYFYRGIK